MEKKQPEANSAESNVETPLIPDRPAFTPGEMVACNKCARANPPDRLRCLYCAAELETAAVRADTVKPVLRKLEKWEKGFNVILHPGPGGPGEVSIEEIAKALSLEEGTIRAIFDSGNPVPVARVEGEREAAFVEDILHSNGVESSIVPDRALAEDIPPKRLRTLRFMEDELTLTLFNTGETERIKSADLALIVIGAVFEKRTETIEKRKKASRKTLDEFETSSDDILIDIYTATDPTGWRIPTSGFDFSCLENEKGILAVKNMKTLIGRLRALAPDAKLADRYVAERETLGHIWDEEARTDYTGLRRSGFGKVDFGKIETSNNLGQFTKYSRLQWQLL